MGIIRRSLWLLKAGGFLGLLTFGAVYLWSYHWPRKDLATFEPATAIVCLAAGLRADGTLGTYTKARAELCIAAYHAGLAPVIAFSGGNTTHDAAATARQMADLARDMRVPERAIVVEDRSQSTLQNAIFTLPKLPATQDLILVTDTFHLPRAAASFYWAGARDLQLLAVQPEQLPRRLLIAEVAKIWINGARALAYSAFTALGVDNLHWMLR